MDPATGPVTVTLERLSLDNLGPKNKLTGRVLDPYGKPIHGAKVEFDFYHTEDGGGCGGACDGVDPLAVTDATGEFLLTSQKPFATMSVTVEARALAKRKFQKLESGRSHELRLTEGAAVTGRLVRDGKPVGGASVGLVSVARGMEEFTGEYDIATTKDGRFVLPNVPPGIEYFLYSRMSDAKSSGGVARVKRFRAGADSNTTDVGDLEIRPAHRVSGRVILSDGKPAPAGTQMMLGREDAWDTLPDVDVKPDGSFAFEGVPEESVGVSVSIRGHRLSGKNQSLDRLNGFSLVGTVSRNIDDLVILLEPGEFKPDYNRNSGPDAQPRDKPLRGADPSDVPKQ